MAKSYFPDEAELEMISLKHLLVRDLNDVRTQEGLVASLVHDIYNYDYFYEFISEPATWKMCEEEASDIRARLAKVEDETMRAQLEKCFDRDYYLKVIQLVDWGKYIGKATRYVELCNEGLTPERVDELFGLDKIITQLVIRVIESGVTHRVLYANNIWKAAEKLRDGIAWFDNETLLSSAAVPEDLYTGLTTFAEMYREREITFFDLKTLYGDNTEVMITDYAEIVRVRNFYFMMMYDRYF